MMDDTDAPVDRRSTPSGPEGDPFLVLTISLLNRSGEKGGMQITLNTRSGIVTGVLIGIDEYLELLEFSEEGRKELLSLQETEEFPRFVHLKNAQFVFGDGCVPTNDGFLWRGRVSEVSGFSIGTLHRTEP